MQEDKPRTGIRRAMHSVRFTVWIYFAIFIIAILLLMWITFIMTLETNYKKRRRADIDTVAEYITENINGGSLTSRRLYDLAYSYDMCIIIQDKYGLTLYSYEVSPGHCLIHGASDPDLAGYREKADEKGVYYAQIRDPQTLTENMLYVCTLGTNGTIGYLMINTSTEPIQSTVNMIRAQMMQISLAMLVLGFGISIFLSQLISTPIQRTTKSAQKLGQGDHNVQFNGKGYNETEQLALTLNYASEEITKVDTMRRDLMANISHDLRTPLTMVKAYAEMIRDLSGDDPVKRDEHLGIIIEESDRLAALVNDILDLTKLENGAAELTPDDFDLGARISSIMTRYTILSERDGYKFYVSVPEGITVRADPIKFDQVIYNLVNNAVNYSGEDKDIYVMAVKTDSGTEISVTDTGPGISKELLPLIFDRYYRAERSKRDVIGTGLGLSIVKQILIMHGFDFGVRSEEGVGSTFWFKI
ncbi:MAG: HAMP domain-containing histidine kinase [Oscillospiraceae bacterium]|nr:HAMP domain-containing histidine kinase [Oscillospiraceae bacterium]